MFFLDDAQILETVDQASLVAALSLAFANGGDTPARMHVDLPGEDGATLLVMPALDRRDAIGVKIVAVIPSNRERSRPTIDGVYVLLDGETAQPIAILSAPALTAVRTAGVCALASRLLSRPDAKTLLMIGSGALAPHLVRAHLSVRAFDRIVLWGRDPEKANALARRLSDLPVNIEVATKLSGALEAADVISCATLSHAPLVEGRHIAAGTHIDLVGSFSPEMREADTDLFRRGRLIVDTAIAFDESGDLIRPLQEGIIDRSAPDLAALVRSPDLGRADAGEITIFKTVGTGLADLAAARYILSRRGDGPN